MTNSVDSIHSNAGLTVGTGTARGIVNSPTQEFTMDAMTKHVIHSDASTDTGTATGIVNSPTREFTMDTLTKQANISHPKYASLFSGIGAVLYTLL